MRPNKQGLFINMLGTGSVIVLLISGVLGYYSMQMEINSLVNELCRTPGAPCPSRLQRFFTTEGWVLLWGLLAISLISSGTMILYRTAGSRTSVASQG